MQSLRDKLMKAGLVTEEQAKKADTERARPRPAPRTAAATPTPRPTSAKETGAAKETRIPKLPPLPGSREHQRLVSKRQLELDRELRETVRAAEVPVDVGATVFYFLTRKNRLRRLELTQTQAKQLENGELAVVERPEPSSIEHALVPAATAEAVLKLSERAVRFWNRGDKPIGFMSDEALAEQHAREAESSEPDDAKAQDV